MYVCSGPHVCLLMWMWMLVRYMCFFLLTNRRLAAHCGAWHACLCPLPCPRLSLQACGVCFAGVWSQQTTASVTVSGLLARQVASLRMSLALACIIISVAADLVPLQGPSMDFALQ
jgi:hypothetical protein